MPSGGARIPRTSKTGKTSPVRFSTERLRAVAQAFTNPGHLGAMVETVPQAVAEYGAQNLGAGDAIVVNDPYRGGTHLNDLVLITPVHDGDEVFGYVATLAHHVDVGGGAPASLGAFREIYQEGIVIPPVKLVAEGEIVGDVLASDPGTGAVQAGDYG